MQSKRKPLTGRVIYRGASLIDGNPIVVIAIPTKQSKANAKTGAMMQTYIMRDDINPMLANKTGADYSICGNCVHRGKPSKKRSRKTAEQRSCYVVLFQGPNNVWKTYKRGRYLELNGHAAIAAFGRGQKIRLGTYGDPAAVPAYIWESLLSECDMHNAYSHQANMAQANFIAHIMMQSVDNEAEARAAWAIGHRTFRVLRDGESAVAGSEIACPSLQGKHCVDCGLCKGAIAGAAKQPKSIVIPAHGAGAGNFA